ncbi:hypothetical protein DL766_001776 [Monosporascus sp. MC13-8B]|uniref:Uncharacterized protein n=1 Tax=Monosporascus cannonballus TaxID=155416 RepID=A0ABY0HFJ0_9PEZI|nr:hypothetical protein DL762_001734 [Monosporascus cannonballus]RYO99455.1 hypothetical protein DL763_001479 [Monosporascus cannonballus]RYP36898.1 hypothetical protein DL766_001776 [Monosporascus sp. MC13-8B]
MARTASALSQLLPVSLWERTVFVKCTPPPATFTERRAVLRALQKNTSEGIEVFKKLKRDGSSFIAVTTQPEAATALINESPFERTFITESLSTVEPKKSTWGSVYDLRGTITAPVNPLPKLQATPTTAPSNEFGLSHRTFTIRCFPPNKTYNHLQVVRSNPLHGPWPDNAGRETFISAALRRSVPAGPLAPALRDWETGNQLSPDYVSSPDEGIESALSILLGQSRLQGNQVYVRERRRARLKEKEIPEVMRSLAAFAAKCKEKPSATEIAEEQRSKAPSPESEKLSDNGAYKASPGESD